MRAWYLLFHSRIGGRADTAHMPCSNILQHIPAPPAAAAQPGLPATPATHSAAAAVAVRPLLPLPAVVPAVAPLTPAPCLLASLHSPGTSDLDLPVPRVTPLETKTEGAAAHGALHGVPLDLPAPVATLLQIQVPKLALGALVTDEAILEAAVDGVAARARPRAPELHTHAADGGALVLGVVNGQGHAHIAGQGAKAVEVEAAVAKAAGAVAVVCALRATARVTSIQGE